MDIYLSVNNREQVLRLPVLPPEFSVTKPQANETFETVTQGQLKLMGTPGLKVYPGAALCKGLSFFKRQNIYSIGISVCFAIHGFLKTAYTIVITETPINMACCVDDFSYTIGKDGNMNYSITLSEFKLVNTG